MRRDQKSSSVPQATLQMRYRQLIHAMALVDSAAADKMIAVVTEDVSAKTDGTPLTREAASFYAQVATDELADNEDFALHLAARLTEGTLPTAALPFLNKLGERDEAALNRVETSLISRVRSGGLSARDTFTLYASIFRVPLVPYFQSGQVRALSVADYRIAPNAAVNPAIAKTFIEAVSDTVAHLDVTNIDPEKRKELLFLESLLQKDADRYAPDASPLLNSQIGRLISSPDDARQVADLVDRWQRVTSTASPGAAPIIPDTSVALSSIAGEQDPNRRAALVIQSATALAANGQYEAALQLAEQLPTELKDKGDDLLRLIIAEAQYGRGDTKLAVEVVRPCRDQLISLYIETLVALKIIRAKDKKSDRNTAFQLLERAQLKARTLEKPPERLYALLGIAEALAAGRSQNAISVFREAVAGIQESAFPSTFRPISRGLVLPGQIAPGRQLYNTPLSATDALREIGRVNFDDAAASAQSIRNPESRMRFLLGLCRGTASQGPVKKPPLSESVSQ
jgi:hypothetical protein